MEENTLEIQELVNLWAQRKAEAHKTTHTQINLKEIEEKRADKPFHAEIIITEGQSEKISSKKSDKHSKVQTVSTVEVDKGRYTTEINETVTTEEGLSFTAGVNVGMSVSAVFGGLNLAANFSGTKDTKRGKEESLTLTANFDLKKGESYRIEKDVYEVQYKSPLHIEVTLSGKIPVKFNTKIHYPENSKDKHKKWDIPVADIFADLEKNGSLPKGFNFKIEHSKVICTFEGEYKYSQYEGDIKLRNTTTNKVEDSKPLPSNQRKAGGKTFMGTGEIKVVAKPGANVNVGDARGVHGAIDLDPEALAALDPETRAFLLKETVTEIVHQGGEFKKEEVKGAQDINADINAKVQAGNALGAVTHLNLRKAPPVAEIPKSDLFSDKDKAIESFGLRVFMQIKNQLKLKNSSLPSDDKLAVLKTLLKNESLSEMGNFVMECKVKNDTESPKSCAIELAKEIIKECSDMNAFDINEIMIEDGFSNYKRMVQQTQTLQPNKT